MVLVVKNTPAQSRRHKGCRFNPLVEDPGNGGHSEFLPREFHGQWSLTRYSPWGTRNQTPLKQLSMHAYTVFNTSRSLELIHISFN